MNRDEPADSAEGGSSEEEEPTGAIADADGPAISSEARDAADATGADETVTATGTDGTAAATGADGTVTATGDDPPPEFETGRYLYCLVRADPDDSIDGTGVEGEPLSLVAVDGVGAVVHRCSSLYDAADLGTVRRWLVAHQAAVDEASEAFGTPLPFRFDTVFQGDDDDLRAWLERERDALERTLSNFAGHWEYRVEVVETEPIDPERVLEADEELRELRDRIEAADDGTAFLLEKQFENRMNERRRAYRDGETDALIDRLENHAREVHRTGVESGVDLGTDDGSASDEGGSDGETRCRLSLLAREASESAIGEVLEDAADEPGVSVRFTGPWPPYSFVPELGDSGGTDS